MTASTGLSGRQRQLVGALHAVDLARLAAVELVTADALDETPTEAVLAVDAGLGLPSRRVLVTVARVLPHLPALRAAIVDGRASFDLAERTCTHASSRRLTVGHLALLDALLAVLLRDRRDADDLWGRVRDEVETLRPDTAERLEAAAVDRVTFMPDLFGGGRIDVEATAVTYPLVTGAIDHVVDRDRLLDRTDLAADDGTDTTRQHNHDTIAAARAAALAAMATDALAGRTGHGTARPPLPSMQVVVPLDALTGQTDEPARLLTGGRLTATTTRRLLSEGGADVRAVVVGDDGTVLGVGRRTRVAPGWLDALTRALQPRCVIPGCRRRATDLDHATRWVDGGTTDLPNLSRVCRRHHVEKDRDGTWHLSPDATGAVTVTHATGWSTTTRPWPNGPPCPTRAVTTRARRSRQPRLPFARSDGPPPATVPGGRWDGVA